MTVKTNLVPGKRQRVPEAGDVFRITLPGGMFLFGRVIRAGVGREEAPMPGSNLIYVFGPPRSTTDINVDALRPANLLLPPVWTNDLPWTKGYFQTIQNAPLGKFDLLKEHCFLKVSVRPDAPPSYVDERGQRRAQPFEPCGQWALLSYRWLDDRISDELGIPRVPSE